MLQNGTGPKTTRPLTFGSLEKKVEFCVSNQRVTIQTLFLTANKCEQNKNKHNFGQSCRTRFDENNGLYASHQQISCTVIFLLLATVQQAMSQQLGKKVRLNLLHANATAQPPLTLIKTQAGFLFLVAA